jgi:excisionase family DNA binding protein
MKPDTKPQETAPLLDYDEAQRYLGGLSRSKIKELAGKGELRVVRVGRRTLFRRDDLDAYIQRHTVDGAVA